MGISQQIQALLQRGVRDLNPCNLTNEFIGVLTHGDDDEDGTT
jgi:hypothetical protein